MKMKSKCSGPTLRVVAGTLALLLVAVSSVTRAAEDGASAPEPPEVASDETGAKTGTVVRERTEHGQVITEYQRRGGVYMMTVKPRVGPTQYWNDPDGDGQFQRSTSDDIDENLNLPKWRLGGW